MQTCTNLKGGVHPFLSLGLCLQPVVILAALQSHAHLLSAPFCCTAPHARAYILSRHLSQFNPLNITSHFVFCHNSLQLIICLINYICAVGRKACNLHLIKCSRLNKNHSVKVDVFTVSPFFLSSHGQQCSWILLSCGVFSSCEGSPVHRRSAVSPTHWRVPMSLFFLCGLVRIRPAGNSLKGKGRNFFAHYLFPWSRYPPCARRNLRTQTRREFQNVPETHVSQNKRAFVENSLRSFK